MNKNAFDACLEKIVSLTLDYVPQHLFDQSWKCAYYDTLWTPQGVGYGGLGKFRVVLLNDSLVADLFLPDGVDDLIDKAWELQAGIFPKTWYGLKIIIYPDGQFDIELDYDRDCFEKKTDFFLDT